MKKNTAQIFAETLKQIGVRYVFGVPSGSMIDYIQAVHDTEGIDFILTAHEAGAAFMAGVCGRLTGIPGACFATFGPGATNLSTGIGAAFLDRSPLLAFTDEMPNRLRDKTVQMNIDHQALFAPITKKTCRLSASGAAQTLFSAANLCISGTPGPVHIGVPSDISVITESAPAPAPEDIKIEIPQDHSTGIPDDAARMLRSARKPVLALGLSATGKELKPPIRQLVDQLAVPVVTTPMAKGIISESHPCYAGVLNHALSDRVAKIHSQADLIIAIGYDQVEIRYEDWVKGTAIIHITPKNSFPKGDFPENTTLITMDPALAIKAVSSMTLEPSDWQQDVLVKNKEQMFNDLERSSALFGPGSALKRLRRHLPLDGILTCDVGAHLHLVGQMWPTPEPGRLLMTNGWSSMGFAIPAAIAAKLCRPHQSVACLVGDGGFLMTAGELFTARRLNLDIVFVVLVDHHLSLIRLKQDNKNLVGGYGTRISNSDILDTDNFLGIPVFAAQTKDKFEKVLARAFKTKGPSIIKAVIDPTEYDALLLKGN